MPFITSFRSCLNGVGAKCLIVLFALTLCCSTKMSVAAVGCVDESGHPERCARELLVNLNSFADGDHYQDNMCTSVDYALQGLVPECEGRGGTYINGQCVGAHDLVTISDYANWEKVKIDGWTGCDDASIGPIGLGLETSGCWEVHRTLYFDLVTLDFGRGQAHFTTKDPQTGACSVPGVADVWVRRDGHPGCPAGYQSRAAIAPGDPNQCIQLIAPPCPSVGNPVSIGNCGKIEREVDILPIAPGGLQFARTFDSNSYFPGAGSSGNQKTWDLWHHTYSRRILLIDYAPSILAVSQREDGQILFFGNDGRELINATGAASRLQRLTDSGGAITGWRYTAPDLGYELFDAAGKLLSITTRTGLTQTLTYSDVTTPIAIAPGPGFLISVTDDFGRTITLTHNADGLLASVKGLLSASDPTGALYTYGYDGYGNLSQVTMPDGKTRQYAYENVFQPQMLTGITDENGVRYATFNYRQDGLVSSTERADGNYRFTFQIDTNVIDGYRGVTYTDPMGTTYSQHYSLQSGVLRNTSTTTSCDAIPCNQHYTASGYDANGNLAYYTEYYGRRTEYTYDLTRNLEVQRIEGLDWLGNNTPAKRTISTQWHPVYRFPSSIAEPLRITDFTYDSSGNLLSKSVQATSDIDGSQAFGATRQGMPRVWTYTYTTFGRIASVNGPRTDVADITTYTYYPDSDSCVGCRGQVHTVTNALNHITSYDSYDRDGRVTQVTDPNGVVTTTTYSPRGWLKTRTVNAGQPTAETTTYFYDDIGQLIQVRMSDNSFISYTYDNSHRLTDTNDSLGNVINYTLDAMGNRTAEYRYDPNNLLTQKRTMVYDGLSQLKQQMGGTNPATDITTYSYDSNGNRTVSTDALNQPTTNSYDARYRLTTVLDAMGSQVGYVYDQLDQLIQVTDPRALVTQYVYDGLGNLKTLSSPDTGITQYTYDDAGNLLTKTDARSNVSTQSYDALNRLSTQLVTNGPSFSYSYDQGSYGVGRLSAIGEGSIGSTQYSYDAFGRISTKTQTLHGRTLTVGYGYAPAGKLNRITYPSGRQLTYSYDDASRVTSISLDGTVLLNQIAWQPFGPPRGWTWGNGTTHQRSYDLDGRIKSLLLPQVPDEQQSFGYDNLLRLTAASTVNTNINLAYSYDATGNRTLEMRNGSSSVYTTATTSNRLASVSGDQSRNFTFNATGSIIQDNAATFTYDGRERMIAAGATSYYVNALGQRIEKSGPGADTTSGLRQFVYDEGGKLLGEYDAVSGTLIAEHFYLNDWPVGVIHTGILSYVHTDHLGTPRAITSSSNDEVTWYWNTSLPFGADLANENPSGLGDFVYNLRLQGQYFDVESNQHYNYFRDYDPQTGRYLESDLIGLAGGIDTYLYAFANPVIYFDQSGLISCQGEWKLVGTDRTSTNNGMLNPFFPYCWCYWLCSACDSPSLWSGDIRSLPRTRGIWTHTGGTGSGGRVDPPRPGTGPQPRGDSGDTCNCLEKPGSETGCHSCIAPRSFSD